MHFYLRDTSADGEHAQARVQSLDGAGSLHLYKWHSAVGYGTAYSENVHVTDTGRVTAVRIQVCRMGDELPPLCDWSRWSENPYQ